MYRIQKRYTVILRGCLNFVFSDTGIGFHSIIVASQSLYRQTYGQLKSESKGFTKFTQPIKCLLVILVLFTTLQLNAQNLNNPNKLGPLGIQVNTFSGNVFIPRTDIFIPARGFDISISFYYNSYLFDSSAGYGNGWGFKYDIRYKDDTANGKAIIWGDGREDNYTALSGSNYKAPRGFFSTLSQYQPDKYLLTELDGTKYFFENSTHKRITKMEEPNGNFISFNYTDTLLTSLVTKAGQAISFTYNNGKLATITDAVASPSRTYSYAYDGRGNLTEVTDPLNGKYKYTYLVNGPMKTYSDKNNNVVDIIYFPDFSARELVGCNKRISFSYDTTSNTTIVTDHLSAGNNQVTKYTYQRLDNLVWLTSMSGNCCGFNMTFEFDDQGNKIKETDANGNITSYTYDSRGNMLTMTDPHNNVSTYTYGTAYSELTSYTDPKGNLHSLEYDAKGNLLKLTEPGSLVFTATYNSNGDIISSTDPNGNIYTYNYDAYGNPVTVAGPNEYTATLAFDARGRLLSYTDARNNTHTAEYDILDRLKKITDPLNNIMQMSYDAEGNLTAFTNKNDEVTRMNYDASNRMIRRIDPMNRQTKLAYDGMDNVLSVINPLGNETGLTYDARNRLKGGKDAMGNNISFGYDAHGNITSASLPNGQILQYSYDKLHRLTTISDATGIVASLAYNANGNLISFTNGTGSIVSAVYNRRNRIEKIIDPLGNTISYTYDNNDNIATITDRNGFTRSYTYDGWDRVKTFSDNNGSIVTIGYDGQGNVTSLKDQNNNITTYTYDNLNRLATTTYPDGRSLQYTYDTKNNLTTSKLTDGTTINYQYDSLNRVVQKTLPGGQVFSYGYDLLGRVTSATNNNGTVAFTYDAINRVTSETFDGRTVRYQYNTAGRTQTTIYPDSTVVVKNFDTRNRLTGITKNGADLVSYQYNNADQVTRQDFGNGLTSTWQYDIANRLSSISTANGTIQNTTFSYDKEGNKTAVNRLNDPSLSEYFMYDKGYRLMIYRRGEAGSPLVQNTYTYDALGNRTSANLNGTNTAYTVNNLNQLTSVNGTALTYDQRGNLTFDSKFYKSYDAENRLIKDSASASSVVEYAYDALNRRVVKTVNGQPFKYTYSLLQQIEERNGGTNALTGRNVFNTFLSPVVREQGGASFFYHQNEMNSVEAISNSNGRVVEKYQYDAYGKLSRYDSTNSLLHNSITGNRFGLTGQEWDSITGNYNFFFRSYSPELGTFMQRDPIGYDDGMGMYQYVGNNPANGIDILGLELGYTPTYDPPITPPNPTIPPPPGNDNCPPKKSSSRLELWDLASNSKQVWEIFTMEMADMPVLKEVMDVTAPFIDSYKATQSIKGYSEAKNSTTRAMHGGDAVKSGTGVVTGLGSVMAGGLGMKGVSQKFGGAGAAFFVWDLETQAMGKFGIQDPIEHEAFMRDLQAEMYLWQQGRTDEEKVARIMKLSQLHRMRQERDRLNKECPKGGTRKKLRLVWDNVKKMWVLEPVDPNEIRGPEGITDKKWVSVKERMPYTVLFENDSSASAPAKIVRITTQIEPKQDASTFQLGSFGFNNQTFDIPANTASYYQRLDCRDSTGLYVDLTAGYDQVSKQAFWEFQSIDPRTLLPTEEPLAGFLFLRDSSQRNYGHGFVNFSIKPLQSAHTLDTIGAKAEIVFDQNEAIPTNIHTNTIDAFAPTTHMNEITASGNTASLSWSGTDDANGSGLKHHTLYVSTDGTNYSIMRSDIRRTDTTITLAGNTTYYFFVVATDSVGNTEALRQGEVKSVFISGSTLPVTWLYFRGNNQGKDNILDWATANEQNSKEFKIERSVNGIAFKNIGSVAAGGNTSATTTYKYTDRDIDKLRSDVFYYRLQQVDRNNNSKYSNIVRLNYNQVEKQKSIVYPNPTAGMITVTIGDKLLIGTIASVYDQSGKLLEMVKITANSQSFNLSKYVSGVYYIKLVNKEVLKVIKQ